MSKYTEDVCAATGAVNPSMLSRRYQCPVIYFHTRHNHAFQTRDRRAEVQFYRDGKRWRSKPIRVRSAEARTLAQSRAAHLAAAIEWAEKHGLGVEEWAPSGYPDAWIPKEAKERLLADVKAWRKEQRAAARGSESSGG